MNHIKKKTFAKILLGKKTKEKSGKVKPVYEI